MGMLGDVLGNKTALFGRGFLNFIKKSMRGIIYLREGGVEFFFGVVYMFFLYNG